MAKYIYQYDQWPRFTWDDRAIAVILGKVRQFPYAGPGVLAKLVEFDLEQEATFE